MRGSPVSARPPRETEPHNKTLVAVLSHHMQAPQPHKIPYTFLLHKKTKQNLPTKNTDRL